MKKKLVTTGALVLVILITKAQTNIYVDISRASNGNGSSWANAYNDLNKAIVYANQHSGKFDIYIAAGVYKPDLTTLEQTPNSSIKQVDSKKPIEVPGPGLPTVYHVYQAADGKTSFWPKQEVNTFNNLTAEDASFAIKKSGIRLFGGYPIGGGTTSDPKIYKTYLEGDLGSGNNAHHVMLIVSSNTAFMSDSVVIDGVTIRNGIADNDKPIFVNDWAALQIWGAGITIAFEKNTSGTEKLCIRNCEFENNYAFFGGAIFSEGCNPVIKNCVFKNNSVKTAGGAIYNALSSPSVSGCTFENNKSKIAAGVVLNATSNGSYSNCILKSNVADSMGGCFANLNSSPNIAGCTFENNTTYGRGGGGVMRTDYGAPKISNSSFKNNYAGIAGGGGVFMDYASGMQISNCTFNQNYAKNRGGVFWFRKTNGSAITINNSTFTGNYADSTSSNNQKGLGGVMISDSSASVVFNNCTFSKNIAKTAGVLIALESTIVTFNNCNISDNRTTYSSSVSKIQDATVNYNACKLTGNSSSTNGIFDNFTSPGFIIINSYGSTLNMIGCIVANNKVPNSFGGIGNYNVATLKNCVFTGNSSVYGYSGIYNIKGSTSTILSCTFEGNVTTGSGKEIYGVWGDVGSTINMKNTIVWENFLYGYYSFGTATIEYSNIRTSISGNGNIYGSPQFANVSDPNGLDNIWGTIDDGLRIGNASPCVDKGNNTASSSITNDITGNPRVTNVTIDIGAYEYFVTTPANVLTFKGDNDYIELPHFSRPDSMTIEARIKTSSSTKQTIVFWGGTNNTGFGINATGNLFYSEGEGSSYTSLVANNIKVNDDKWHHVAVTRNGSTGNNISLYMDGVSIIKGNLNLTLSTSQLIVGSWAGLAEMFNGQMDEVRIWNRTLCGGEIAQNKTCELNSGQTKLMAYYKFNQGNSGMSNVGTTSLTDASGNNRNGTLKNFDLSGNANWMVAGSGVSGNCNSFTNPVVSVSSSVSLTVGDTISLTAASGFDTYSWAGPGGFSSLLPNLEIYNIQTSSAGSYTLTAWSNGCASKASTTVSVNPIPASALSFNFDDYITIPHFALGAEYTIEAMLKNPTKGAPFISWSNTQTFDKYNVLMTSMNGGQLEWRIRDVSWPYITYIAGPNVADGNWHHVAVVKTNSSTNNVFMYVDGVLVAENLTLNINPVTTGINIGQWPNWSSYEGQMDEVRIWNRALCTGEINAHKGYEISSASNGLVAYYKFSQGFDGENNTSIISLTDAAGGDHNGTFSGFNFSGGTEANFIKASGTGSIATGVANPSPFLRPDLNSVTGNGSTIPSASNNTDFGYVDNTTSLTKSFVISNTGTGTLKISGITLSGSGATLFSVSGIPTTVPSNTTGTFDVAFNPASTTGEKTAVVSISSDDCRNNPFTFAVKGNGVLVLPGAALNFDGVDDEVILPNIPLSNGFTYEAKIRTTATHQGIIHRGNGPSPQGSVLWIENGYMVYKEVDGGNNGAGVVSSVKVNDGQWHHVAAVKRDTSSGYVSLYVDGGNVGNGKVKVNYSLNITLGYIGFYDYNKRFAGNIDEVRIWNIPRCEAEIANTMNCEVGPSSAGLVAYYQCNQGVADGDNTAIAILTDATSSAYSGALSGFAKTGTSSNFIVQGGITSGTSCGSYSPAAVQVSLVGGAVISNSVSDTSDFGFNDINSGAIIKTFRIKNTGTGNLNFNGSPRVVVSGNGFSLYQDVTQTIAPSDSSDFTISFDPDQNVPYSAKITFYSNDCDDNPFTFSVKGEGVGGPPTAAALDFDGTDDYVNVGYFSEPATMTIEAMVKFTRAGHNPIIAWTGPNSNISVFHFVDGKIYFYRQVDATIQYDYDKSGDTLNDGNWHHVAFVQNGDTSNNLFLYVDGSLKVNYTGTFAPVTNTLSIGAWPGYLPFKGQMDEIRIWKKALCVAEILNNMNTELRGTNPDLLAYYRVNQGQNAGTNPFDTTLTDASGNGNNGTLSNFALTGATSNWIAPGGVTTGSIASIYVPAKIVAAGNNMEIANNDITPSVGDNTDFGDVFTGLSKTVTFSISNPSNGTLVLTDPALVSLTGTGLSVTTNVNNDTIAPNETKTFDILFAPTTAGLINGTITIKNTDCDNPVFTFSIRANGVEPVPATALNFDGIDDGILIYPNIPVLPNGFSYEAMIRTTGLNQVILQRGDLTFSSQGSSMVIENGYLVYKEKDGGNTGGSVISSIQVNDGQWHHVAAVKWDTLSNDVSLYVDGVNVGNGAVNTNYSLLFEVLLLGVADNIRFTGDMDEVRIWNRPLCEVEIAANTNCEVDTASSGLAAYYKFNQGFEMFNNSSYNTLPDMSTNNNNGTLSGFGLTGAASNWLGGSIMKKEGSCPAPPKMSVTGNSITIANNDTVPSVSDHTDFGNVPVDSVFTNTFTIMNNGNNSLTISGLQNVLVTGNGFTLATDVAGSIAGGQIADFTIDFKPPSIGQYTGTVTIFSNDCDEGTYTFSIAGNSTPGAALHFDTYDFAEVDSPFYQFNNEITVEGWLNIESTDFGAGFGQATYGVDDMATNVWLMHFANPNTIDFFCNDNGTWRQVTGIISAGWHHVAAVASPDKSEFYVDGIVHATGPGISAGIVNNAASVINFGKDVRNGFRFCKAAFDEVRIWNRALCHSEILHNYNAELSMPQNGLVGYYQFNHGQTGTSNAGITMLADSSGNNAHGTLYGFTLSSSTSNWIAPGAVVTGSDNGIFFPSDIQVYGNNLNIQSNDTTPSITDHTDFGDIASISGNSMSRVFTIKNPGNKTLYLNNNPRVTLTGSDFMIVTDAPDSMLPGASATFEISFTPSLIGISTGLVTINNSDCDDPAFMFYIRANGIAPPQASALHFDGGDNYVEITTPFYQFNNEMTFECWLNAENAQLGSGIGQASAGSDDMTTNVWLLHFVDKNFIQFFCNDSGTWRYVSVTNFSEGWHHVAAIASVDKLDLYIDGVLQDSRAGISSGIVNNASSVIQFGKDVRYASGKFYQGIFDEVRIWNRALKLSELSYFKDCEHTGNPKGLLGYYQFNQGLELSDNSTVKVLTDSSVYNKPGTLNNFALNGSASNWINPGAMVSGNTCTPCVNLDTILSVVSCVPYTSPSGAYIWSSTGNYSDTLESVLGCDSIITVNLTVNSIATDKIIIAQDTLICGDSGSTNIILVGSDTGVVYTLLNVDNNQAVDGPKNGTGDSLLFSTGTLTASTNLRMEAAIQSSCSAFMDNEITVVVAGKPNSSYVVNDTNLYANAIEISYQWVDCNNDYALLTGETNDKLVTNGTGSYALIAVNDYSCVDTSSCFTFIAPQP